MAKTPDYVFTRDFIDNNRFVSPHGKSHIASTAGHEMITKSSINLQHHLWVELFGYLTHPQISIAKKAEGGESLRIADVGTGTGIWLTDVGSRLPTTVQLDGLDISTDATPPAAWLPSNMSIKVWDVKQPPPAEIAGTYDLVHIRNFAFVLRDDNIPKILENLKALLKPAGYLQWGEPDVASFRIEKTNPDNKSDALTGLLQLSQGQDARLKPTWVPNLPPLFEKAGFDVVVTDVRDAPPHMALAMHECNLLIHELIARKTQSREVAEGLAQLMPEVMRETRNGACCAFTRYTVVGRKSM